jgi:Flp pilus assembly protein TadG
VRSGRWKRLRDGVTDQRGSALIEFTLLSVLLLVPLAYLVLAVFSVQRAAFGVTAATREAGRAYVTTTDGDPTVRAQAAAALALRDQGLILPAGALRISCETDCRTAGTAVHVALDYTVVLPVVPRALGGHSLGGIPVRGRHTQLIDEFRPEL